MYFHEIKTADVILVQADSLLSLLAYHFLSIEYLHVGLAVWVISLAPLILVESYQKNAKLYIWETDPIPKIDAITKTEIIGCHLIPWSILERTSCEIAIRNIHPHHKLIEILSRQINERHGQIFAKGGLGMLYATLGIDYIPKHTTLHCTELVGEFLNEVLVVFNYKKYASLFKINPYFLLKKGPFDPILLDDKPRKIFSNGWGLRAYIIHLCIFLLVISIIFITIIKIKN